MPEILERTRQLQLRLVYFGPPKSGKAANLQRIHELLPPELRSRIRAFDVGQERTVSFDMTLPRESEDAWAVSIVVAGCSSPLLQPTKIALVEACDAIAFVADAARTRREENHEAFRECEELLRTSRRPPKSAPPPIVLQVNKRDRDDALRDDEIESEWGARGWPMFTAAAKAGDGVRETFTCLLRLAFEAADKSADVGKRTGLTLSGVTAASLTAFRKAEPGAARPKGAAS